MYLPEPLVLHVLGDRVRLALLERGRAGARPAVDRGARVEDEAVALVERRQRARHLSRRSRDRAGRRRGSSRSRTLERRRRRRRDRNRATERNPRATAARARRQCCCGCYLAGAHAVLLGLAHVQQLGDVCVRLDVLEARRDAALTPQTSSRGGGRSSPRAGWRATTAVVHGGSIGG